MKSFSGCMYVSMYVCMYVCMLITGCVLKKLYGYIIQTDPRHF